ncbi:MAG: hypothetical protein ACOYBY_13650 [Dermatophilaceae bacterium]
MSEASPQGLPALLLLRGQVDAVARWLGKGVTPAVLAGCPHGWVAVTPASGVSLAAPPYDDASSTLLARPVPRRHRPAIGWRVVGPRLLICVVPDAVAARPGWLAWEPGQGLIRPGGLPTSSAAQLAQAAGAGGAVEQVRQVLHAPQGEAPDVAGELFEVLGLPGIEVFFGAEALIDRDGARRIEPERHYVAAFERAVGDGRGRREERDPS